jgi:hypothetical protein
MNCGNCHDWKDEYIKIENKYSKLQNNFLKLVIGAGILLAIMVGLIVRL